MPRKKPPFDETPFASLLGQCPRCGHWMGANRLEPHQRTCTVDPVARMEEEKRLERDRKERMAREAEEERQQGIKREREWAQLERKREEEERVREQREHERNEEQLRVAAENKARDEELLAQERWVVSVLRSKRDPDIIVVIFELVGPKGDDQVIRSWSKTDKVSEWRFGKSFPVGEGRTFERYTLESRFEVDGPGRVAQESQSRLDRLVAALPQRPTT